MANPNPLISFLKKTYKVLIVIFAAIIFFLGYNTYLVDRSLANLKITLGKVSDAKTLQDAQRLAAALDYSLITEVTDRQLKASNIARIEMAKDILSSPQDMSQLKDAQFAIQEVIKQKESQRPAILVALDKIGGIFAPAAAKISEAQLEEQAKYLQERIKALKDKDRLQEAYYDLANIYTKIPDFARAKEAYLKAIDLNTSSKLARKCRFILAWNEKRQGNFEKALKDFESLSQAAGEDKLAMLSKYQMADTYRKKGDYQKAAEIYQEVGAEGQDKDLASLAEFRAGYTYLYDLKDYEKARQIFDKVKDEFKGTSISGHIKDTAMPSLLAQYCKEGFILLKQGYESSNLEKYKEAQRYFDQALQAEPDNGTAYTGKALASLWLNDREKAIEFARRAVELAPNKEITSVNLGFIYLRLGLVDEAIKEYQRFIATNPFTANGYYNLGYAYIVQNKLNEAVVAFHQAGKINPKLAYAYNNKGWCLWKLGRYAEAVEAFQSAIVSKPDFVDARFNLGAVYRMLGRYRDAKTNFSDILKIDSQYPGIQNILKEIDSTIGQLNK